MASHGVPHTLIVDNAGGHLMQHGQVDMVIVGTDRTTPHGDVCNKIGTYLKALAARDNGVPFYVGLPSPTIDWTVRDGLAEIPIEERIRRRGHHSSGAASTTARLGRVRISPGRHARAATPPSTSRPPASSPASSPNAASARPPPKASPPSSRSARAPDLQPLIRSPVD